MATTTAAVTLNSDLMSANISVSASTTLMKAGTTADGLDMIDYGVIDIVTGDQFDLLDADNPSSSPIAGVMANKANKVYIANHSTDETYYVDIMIDAQAVGKLYAGDWMFIPWGAEDADADIEITANTGTNKIEYALFHQGRTLDAS
tara:strand:+ start:1529 stop:1969 length:441 start_codon:yes stop_codon:yes gene_type:complete